MPENEHSTSGKEHEGATRKHLSLIVEHQNDDRVGGVMFYDSPKARLTKNEKTPMQRFNKDTGEFYVAGKEVGIGYVDFESEREYKNWPVEKLREKLREIDREWIEQAGIFDLVYPQDAETEHEDETHAG